MPARIVVAYVRELELAAPPAVAPAPAPIAAPPVRAAPRAPVPRPPASAPVLPPEPAAEPAETAPPPEPAFAAAPEPEPGASAPVAEAPTAVLDAPPEPSLAASAAEVFEWPASTRLTYALTGNYRGEVLGDAQVEWVRDGSRYQVHLDVTIGAAFAPLITRRMSSDGELGADGLVPQRYDEDTKVMFRERRRVTMRFEPDRVVLADGRERERPPGVQDSASQFVQLAWMFTLRPELLRSGSTVEVALALPRNVDRWVFDVLGEETLHTPFGAVASFHLKPRRSSRPGGDLTAEIWFAPQLRYLPARIRIEQDPQTFIDLLLSRKPELAEN